MLGLLGPTAVYIYCPDTNKGRELNGTQNGQATENQRLLWPHLNRYLPQLYRPRPRSPDKLKHASASSEAQTELKLIDILLYKDKRLIIEKKLKE